MELIDYLHVLMAVLFTITALQRYKYQGESFFIRLVLAGWFFLTSIFHDMPVAIVRNTSTTLIIVMLFLESTAPYLQKHWERRKWN